MNSSNNLFFVLIILFAEKAVSREVHLSKEFNAPLALIRKRDSKLERAIPQNSKTEYRYFTYDYDDSEDNLGRVEEFNIACPAGESNKYKQEELKKISELVKTSKLFILEKYTKPAYTCSSKIQPSIKKAEKEDIKKAEKEDKDPDVQYCQKYNADLYYVGYPVSENVEKDLQFVSIYKICYSGEENTGLLYTIHHIESSSFLLEKLWKFYKLDLDELIRTALDKSDISKTYKKKYVYQYVGFNDMPANVWKKTTLFSFNYFPISKSKDILKGLIAADNYLRLFSKETGKRLIVYSGTYQKIIDVARILCLPDKKVPVGSFWRLIMNDEGKAIILVTQYTQIKCDDQTYLCADGRDVIKVYKDGGCTYTCPVTDLLYRFNLPPLKTTGILSLKIPKRTQTGSNSYVGVQSSYSYVSMSDFLENLAFLDVLKTYDEDLASNMQIPGLTDGYGYIDLERGNSEISRGRTSYHGDIVGGGSTGIFDGCLCFGLAGGFDSCF